MEDVLDVYEKPYDPNERVARLDEKPITLHADVRPATAANARPGATANTRGTANAFLAVKPKAGKHFGFPTPDRIGFQFALVALKLVIRHHSGDVHENVPGVGSL